MKKKYVYFVSYFFNGKGRFGRSCYGDSEVDLNARVTHYSQIEEIRNKIMKEDSNMEPPVILQYKLLRVEEVK